MEYFRRDGDKIVCLLCRHYCKLKEDQVGICGVNQNKNQELKTLVYGKVAALNVDPIEKKPLYHFLPSSHSLSLGSVGCNFQCPFCQNWQISQISDLGNSHTLSPKQIVNLAKERGCESISFTYNEPTIFYPFAKDIALLAKKDDIRSVFVSNGFESREVIEDMRGVIDAFNIDLKSFSEDYYKKSLKGSLKGVLDTLKRVKDSGFWLEVTTLIVPDVNDSLEELESIVEFIANELDIYTPWHISAFHPDFKMRDGKSTTIEKMYEAKEIAERAGLKYVYMGNVRGEMAITKCPDCGYSLIKRDGFRVIENQLKDGKCPKCTREIEGVFQ
jgi:pyruvate formate lyase activating enzyme